MTDDEKREILARADLIYFVQDVFGIKLKKVGRVYKCDCLFHDERSASLTFWPHNGTWKCLGQCGAHGDVITFVMKYKKYNYIEACKFIGGIVGVSISDKPIHPDIINYKETMTKHADRYHKTLYTPQGAAALNYLYSRGFDDVIIKNFNLGFVPNDEYQYRKDLGGISGRVSFPIYDLALPEHSKVLGMGYRTLKDLQPGWDSKKDPKYINDRNTNTDSSTPERKDTNFNPNLGNTFIKGNVFYGLSQALPRIRDLGYAIIAEGYADVISLHKSGITNTIGLMTASFTDEHIEMLTKMTKTVILFLDTDETGIANMIRYIPKFIAKGFNVQIIINDTGKDPADICFKKKFVPVEVNNYIRQNAQYAIEFFMERATRDYKKMVSRERMMALSIMNPILEILPKVQQQVFTDKLLKILDMK